jgi:hypothetical protein
MITRVVIVEFHPDVTAALVAEFRGWLEDVAARTPGLIRMICGEHMPASSDPSLSANAPDAVFGNFMSVWEFSSEEALDDYLTSPYHRALAATRFPRVVRRRYLANIG